MIRDVLSWHRHQGHYICKKDEVEILEVHCYEFLPVKINECTMDEEFLGDESLKRMSMEVDFQLH
jgi:hypothetical protein